MQPALFSQPISNFKSILSSNILGRLDLLYFTGDGGGAKAEDKRDAASREAEEQMENIETNRHSSSPRLRVTQFREKEEALLRMAFFAEKNIKSGSRKHDDA